MKFGNGNIRKIKESVKGPYRKLDVAWWTKKGKSFVDNTSFKWARRWKWARF